MFTNMRTLNELDFRKTNTGIEKKDRLCSRAVHYMISNNRYF